MKVVADFRPPEALRRLHKWEQEHAEVIAAIPDDAVRVEVGHLWSVLAVISKSERQLPSETEQRLAEFAELFATAIANSQAHEQLEQFADEQAAGSQASSSDSSILIGGPTPSPTGTCGSDCSRG